MKPRTKKTPTPATANPTVAPVDNPPDAGTPVLDAVGALEAEVSDEASDADEETKEAEEIEVDVDKGAEVNAKIDSEVDTAAEVLVANVEVGLVSLVGSTQYQ